jgi:hypothetical protein
MAKRIKVLTQSLSAHLFKGSLYDFEAQFILLNPDNSYEEAFYAFDKYGSGKDKGTVQDFEGAKNFNETIGDPFHWDTLADDMNNKVEAQVSLVHGGKERFTINVERTKKRNYSVDLTFKGEVPDWLAHGQKWSGKLVMYATAQFNSIYP